MFRTKAEYHRATNPAPEGTPVATAVGVDIGTAFLALARITRYAEPHSYVLDHLLVVSVCGPQGQDDVDTVGTNVMALFAHPAVKWFWEPASPVLPERQVDHIFGIRNKVQVATAAVDEDSAESEDDVPDPLEKPEFKPPIMNAVYGMIKQIVLARRSPTAVLDDAAWQELMAAGVDPQSPAITRAGIQWIPRSGSQKTGLKGLRGAARKAATLTVGPEVMAKFRDKAAAAFLRTLASQKPREDACDVCLQIVHYFEEIVEGENKVLRREAREAARAEKLAAKKQKREEREEARAEKERARAAQEQARAEKLETAKRKREEQERLKGARPAKKARVAVAGPIRDADDIDRIVLDLTGDA